ncbi:hypothetical protein [Gymnodinialimonas sp.]
MSRWTTSTDRFYGALRLSVLLLGIALAACGPAHVQVEGEFPTPLIEPLPLKLGLWYADEFRNHEFHDEAKAPGDSDWVVTTGEAQVKMWDTLLQGMFTELVHLESEPGTAPTEIALDGVLIPSVDELQYAIPTHTSIKVYEIWMRYRFKLVSPAGEPIGEWTMTSYGKTPTAFLQSDEAAVNFAAVMALRDAGANFATSFTSVPVLQPWLQSRGVVAAEPAAAP